jgi:oxaloacetate decarboxylase gamma subunit
MASDLMAQGVELMLAGMGTVFVFLTLLVGATVTMSRLIALLESTQAKDVGPDAEEVAVITAAVVAHRRRRRESP